MSINFFRVLYLLIAIGSAGTPGLELPILYDLKLGTRRTMPPFGKPMLEEFLLSPNISYLNHGGFGTVPKVVLKAMQMYQERAEADPTNWLYCKITDEISQVRKLLAQLMNADPEDLVIIPNVTKGMNIILKGIVLAMGERILHFNTAFSGVKSMIQYIIDQSKGAVSRLIFDSNYPISDEELVRNFENFLQVQDPQRPIRLAVLDHITSAPGVIVPIDKLIPVLKRYNISTVIDGAHSIGHVPVDLQALDPDYYVIDVHKWMFVPRGFSALYVKKEWQSGLHPLEITDRYSNSDSPSRFQKEFFWSGTNDYSAYLTLSAALQFIEDAGGLERINDYNHNLALEGGKKMASKLGTEVMQEEGQMGNMVDVRLPLMNRNDSRFNKGFWNDMFYKKYNRTYMKIYNHNGHWWARASAQIYNDLSDFDVGAEVLANICNDANNS